METSNQGRPYRSHLRPACDACRRRKSRCTTTETSDQCLMCQVHGSRCVFVDGEQTRRRKVPASQGHVIEYTESSSIDPDDSSMSMVYPGDTHISDTVLSDGQTYHSGPAPMTSSAPQHAPAIGEAGMSAMLAESGDSSTHIISPAIVDDNEELDSYLSSNPAVGVRRITRTSSTSSTMGPPSRRVLFNTVLKKPLGIHARQTLAASKLEVIEKLLEPHIMDLIDLHVICSLRTLRLKANEVSAFSKTPTYAFLS
jgi:hypothetical protein